MEERQIAPDGVPAHTGARYFAVDYPANSIFHAGQSAAPNAADRARPAAAPRRSLRPGRILDLYRTWPVSLAPQYRQIFRDLLRHDGAVSYHCSAGQDRAGVATALILTALGVPRAVILQDYLLSTADRRPAYEIPPLTAGEYPGNVVADFYLRMQAAGPRKPGPLTGPDGVPFCRPLSTPSRRAGGRWTPLDQELGVGPADIAACALFIWNRARRAERLGMTRRTAYTAAAARRESIRGRTMAKTIYLAGPEVFLPDAAAC